MKKININLKKTQNQFEPKNVIFFNLEEDAQHSFLSLSFASIDLKTLSIKEEKNITFDVLDKNHLIQLNEQISKIPNPIFIGFSIDKNFEEKINKIINDFDQHLFYDPSTIFTKQTNLKELGASSGFAISSNNDDLEIKSKNNLETLKSWFQRVGINQFHLKIDLFNSFFDFNFQELKHFLKNSNTKIIPQILKFDQTLEQVEKITPLTFKYQPHDLLLKEMEQIRKDIKTIKKQLNEPLPSEEKKYLEKQLLSGENLIKSWDSLLNFNFIDKSAKSKSKNIFYKMLWKYKRLQQDKEKYNLSLSQEKELKELFSIWNSIINNFSLTNKKEINIEQIKSTQSLLKNKNNLDDYEKYKLNILNNIIENWNIIYDAKSWSSNFKFYGLDVSLGEGGVHASNNGKIFENETISVDVASYYPNEIINRLPNLIKDLESKSLSLSKKTYYKKYTNSLNEYSQLLKKRLDLKKQNDPKQVVYKLIINQLYGLIGATFSPFYNNQFAFNICFNGQFQLLLLVHWLEQNKIVKNWIQLNTDGIHFELIDQKPQTLQKYKTIIERWEKTFNFQLEETKFKKFFNFNINNFIGQTNEGKIKTKGAFLKDYDLDLTKPGLDSQATASELNIIGKMLTNWFLKNQTFEETINENPQLWKYQTIVKTSNSQDKILIQYPEQNLTPNSLNHPVLKDLIYTSEEQISPFNFIDSDIARCFFSTKEQKIARFKINSEFEQCDENSIKNKFFGPNYQSIYQSAIIDRDPKSQKLIMEQINKNQNQGLIADLVDKKTSELIGPSYRQIKTHDFNFDSENIEFYDFFINTTFPFDIKKALTKETIKVENKMFLIKNPQFNPSLASLEENLSSFNRLSNKNIELENSNILYSNLIDFPNLDLKQYYQFAIDVLKSYKEFDFEEFLKSKNLTIDQITHLPPKPPINNQIPKNRF